MADSLRAAYALLRMRFRSHRLSPAAFWIWLSSVGLYQALGLAFVLVTTTRLRAGSEWLATLTYGIFQGATALAYAAGAWTVFFASRYVRGGEIDRVLLLPPGPYVVLPFVHFEFGEVPSTVSGFAIAVLGLYLGGLLSTVTMILVAVGIVLGSMVTYSLFVLAATAPLLSKQFSASINAAMDLILFGQYPIRLYPSAMRTIFTWVVPVALIANAPARLVEHGAGLLPLLAGASSIAFLGAHGLFLAALRRFLSHW